MRLTQDQLKQMLPGQTLIAKCIDAAEWESAKRTAQKVRSGYAREDGQTYTVAQDVRQLTVTVETSNNTNH